VVALGVGACVGAAASAANAAANGTLPSKISIATQAGFKRSIAFPLFVGWSLSRFISAFKGGSLKN
jgi:hypothetical protein